MDTDKMYIEFDIEKLSMYNMSLIEAEEYINALFSKKDMILDEKGWYVNGSFEKIGFIVMLLSDMEWFMNSVKKWYWYDGETGGCEDVLFHRLNGKTRYVNNEEDF